MIEDQDYLIGFCLEYPERKKFIFDKIRSDYFTTRYHQRLFEILKQYPDRNFTVVDLKKHYEAKHGEKLEASLITRLVDFAYTDAHIESAINTVSCEGQKQLIKAFANDIDGYAEAVDLYRAIVEFSQGIYKETSGIPITTEPFKKEINQLERIRSGEEKPKIVPFGISPIDYYYKGMCPGQVFVVGAATRVGKTSLMCSMLAGLLKKNYRCLVLSLEMTESQIIQRLLSIITGFPLKSFLDTEFTDKQFNSLKENRGRLDSMPLTIIADPQFGVRGMCSYIDGERNKGKDIDVIFIDYLQIIKSEGSNPKASPYEKTTEVSKNIKRMALKYGLPVVALAQLSREHQKQKDPTPHIHDLRESGQIEQDAEAVFLLHRPGAYDDTKDPRLATLIAGKVRNRQPVNIDLYYHLDTLMFTGTTAIKKG